jgi:hypothetical protein
MYTDTNTIILQETNHLLLYVQTKGRRIYSSKWMILIKLILQKFGYLKMTLIVI